jgi:hypothetical protein
MAGPYDVVPQAIEENALAVLALALPESLPHAREILYDPIGWGLGYDPESNTDALHLAHRVVECMASNMYSVADDVGESDEQPGLRPTAYTAIGLWMDHADARLTRAWEDACSALDGLMDLLA